MVRDRACGNRSIVGGGAGRSALLERPDGCGVGAGGSADAAREGPERRASCRRRQLFRGHEQRQRLQAALCGAAASCRPGNYHSERQSRGAAAAFLRCIRRIGSGRRPGGRRIGPTGTTGNADSRYPHLHFGIRSTARTGVTGRLDQSAIHGRQLLSCASENVGGIHRPPHRPAMQRRPHPARKSKRPRYQTGARSYQRSG
jgi:hypothetical protein